MVLTNYEKQIYNDFLVASRTTKHKPFKIRQDFSKLQPSVYCNLKKISSFFQRNAQIKPKDFFSAPYKYYGAEDYFSLEFFNTPKAIRCYSLYLEQRERDDPDNQDNIARSKECCKFIYNFCIQHNLTLTQYKTYNNGTTPVILQHLRDHSINFYTIHGLDCERVLRTVESNLLDFFIKDFYKILDETRLNFQKSTQLKVIIRKALNIVEVELLKKQTHLIQ
jgi:hypothetical protein